MDNQAMEKININQLLSFVNRLLWIGENNNWSSLGYQFDDFRTKLYNLRTMLTYAEQTAEKIMGCGALDKEVEIRIKYGLCRMEFLSNEFQLAQIQGINVEDSLRKLAMLVCHELPLYQDPEREGPSFVRRVQMIGRQRETEETVNFLTSLNLYPDIPVSVVPVTVVPILGMPGTGKTSFVNRIFYNLTIREIFQHRKWVGISGLDSGAEILDKVFAEKMNMDRYLVVLEVLSNEDHIHGEWVDLLEDFLTNFQSKPGSIIIVISRSFSFLFNGRSKKNIITSWSTSKDRPYHLGPLLADDSLALFQSIAFRGISEEDRKTHLSIALEISNICSGNPRVISIVASILSCQPPTKWQYINKILLDLQDPVQCILSVVDLMQQEHPVLNYYSLFPLDHEFSKAEFNQHLGAQEQSIFPESYASKETFESYFKKLRSSGYIIECPRTEKNVVLVYYKAQVLLEEVVKQLARHEYRLLEKPTVEVNHLIIKHVSFIVDYSWEAPLWIRDAKQLKSLLFFPSKSCQRIVIPDLHLILQNLEGLLALDLAIVNCTSCLSSIGELKFLRYLRLGISSETLPECITNLVFLRTLDLRCSKVRELPLSFHKLYRLRHMYIGGSLIDLPPKFGELTELQTLDVFIVGPNNGLDALHSFTHLTGKLIIRYQKGREEHVLPKAKTFLKDKKLHELSLEWSSSHNADGVAEDDDKEDTMELELLQPPFTLKSLSINGWKGEKFPQWARDHFSSFLNDLVSVHIANCSRCTHLPSFSKLGSLKLLELWGLNSLEWIESCNDDSMISSETTYFPSLEHLTLVNLPQLKRWSRVEEHDAECSSWSLPSLLNLRVSGCAELMSMPCMTSLQSLDASNIHQNLLHDLLSFHGSPAIPKLESLRSLKLSNLSETGPLSKGFECLTKLTELSLCWLYNLRSLPESMQHLIHLRKLVLRYLPNIASLSESLAGLSELENVEIQYCPRLKQVPIYFSDLKLLKRLQIKECVILEKRCQQPDGEDWTRIKHISDIILG